MKQNSSLDIIKSVIEESLPDSEVILFGSRAKKENYVFSDYDILIITKMYIDIKEKRNLSARFRKILASFKIPVDLIILSESELSIKRKISGHIIQQAISEGIAI